METKDIDKVLQKLYMHRGKMFSDDSFRDLFGLRQDINVGAILDFIANEGYAIREQQINSSAKYLTCISYPGIVFYESSAIKGEPFKYLYQKNKRAKLFLELKLFFSIIYSILIIAISAITGWATWLTYKSNVVNTQIESRIRKLEIIFNSRTRMDSLRRIDKLGNLEKPQ